MSDWGRIHRKFHDHPKVHAAGLEAVGLWTIANSWSRDNRTAGFVSDSFLSDEGLHFLADKLVQAGLWLKVEGGYRFKDWDEWNADETPKTTAAKLVYEVIPPGHPNDVVAKLTAAVSDLLVEGIEYTVVRAALKLWLAKDNAPPSWLPLLVSDVVRKNGHGEREAALREAWKTGDLAPLQRWGLVFTPPPIPRDITSVEDAKDFMRHQKRKWIEQIQQGL